MKTIAVLALGAIALAGCGSPIPESGPTEVPNQHVLTENVPTGHGSLSPFLEDYAPEVFEASTLDEYLDHYVPEEGER